MTKPRQSGCARWNERPCRRTSTGTAIAYGWEEDAWYAMHWPGLCTYRFASDDPHITAFPEAGASRVVVYDVYRRSVLPMALQALGSEALHASAIEADGRVIALPQSPRPASQRSPTV